jgi:hypothetical protein
MMSEHGVAEKQTRERFSPSAAWVAAFRAQYPAARAQLMAPFAARRAAGIGPKALARDDAYRQLIDDAFSDTALGRAAWDFETKLLRDHIKDVLRRRTALDWQRARKYPHESIDATTADGHSPTMDEVDRVLQERQGDEADRERARDGLAELREHAADDPDLLAYIAARAQKISRVEFLAATGFSEEKYRSLRRRLDRLLHTKMSIQVGPKRSPRSAQS